MKQFIILAFFVSAFTFTAVAQTKISPKDAAKHIGEEVTLTGKVFGSKFFDASKMTLLDIGGYNPHQDLTLMISGENRGKFKGKPEEDYKGKEVTVTGKLIDFKGKPEIVVSDPSQLKIVLADNVMQSVH
jgi:DNA/RNA endonuclease YhcR with UshA esterase domain